MRDYYRVNKNNSLDKMKPIVSHNNLIEGIYIKKGNNMNNSYINDNGLEFVFVLLTYMVVFSISYMFIDFIIIICKGHKKQTILEKILNELMEGGK